MLKYETPLSFSRVNTVNMHYLLLRSKYYPVLKYLYIAYLLNVTDLISHPYRTTYNILMYLAVFVFIYRRREDERFQTEW